MAYDRRKADGRPFKIISLRPNQTRLSKIGSKRDKVNTLSATFYAKNIICEVHVYWSIIRYCGATVGLVPFALLLTLKPQQVILPTGRTSFNAGHVLQP